MSFKKCWLWLFMLLLICLPDDRVTANVTGARARNLVHAGLEAGSPDVQTTTAEELKSKIERKEPVTIIDVRSTNSYVQSSTKIKGAIYVKLRRLRFRLTLPPLKDVPRDREIITYCSCPADEASIEAAKVLSDAGFKRVRVLKGGWRVWLKANGPVENKPRGI